MLPLLTTAVMGYKAFNELTDLLDSDKKEKGGSNQNTTNNNVFINLPARQSNGGPAAQGNGNGNTGTSSPLSAFVDMPPDISVYDPNPRPFPPSGPHGCGHPNVDIDIDIDIDINFPGGQPGGPGSPVPGTNGKSPQDILSSLSNLFKSLSPEQLGGLKDLLQLLGHMGHGGPTNADNPIQGGKPVQGGGGNPSGPVTSPSAPVKGEPVQGEPVQGGSGTSAPEKPGLSGPMGERVLAMILKFLEKILAEMNGGEKEDNPISSPPPISVPPAHSSGGPSQKRVKNKSMPKDKVSHYNPQAFHGSKSAVVLAKGKKAKSVTIDGVKCQKHGSLDKGREAWTAGKAGLKGDVEIKYEDGTSAKFKVTNDGINVPG